MDIQPTVIVVVIAVSVLLSGCSGVVNNSTTKAHTVTPNGETPTVTPTTTQSITDNYSTTTESSPERTSTVTPSSQDDSREQNNQSRYVETLSTFTEDNTVETLDIQESGSTVYVNYSQSNITGIRSLIGPLRQYVLDYARVVRGDLEDNVSDWDTDRMVVHVEYANGTSAARYAVYDYWVRMQTQIDGLDRLSVPAYAFHTLTRYSPEDREWVDRTIYTPQFRERVNSSLGSTNATVVREGQTIFVHFQSDADRQQAINNQLQQLLIEYAELHEYYFNSQDDTYDTTLLSQPFVLDVSVSWETRNQLLRGRISGYGAEKYNNEEYGLDGYLENFLNSSVIERAQLRDPS